MTNLDIHELLLTLKGEQVPSAHPHILIGCFPKSGSTWLANTIASLEGLSRVSLLPGIGGREHELDLIRCLLHHQQGYVCKAHIRSSEVLVALTRQLSIRNLVLVRNIFDTLVSLDDHLMNDPDSKHVWSMAIIPHDYNVRSPEQRYQFLVRYFVPWLLNFVLRWRVHPGAIWVHYEDLNQDPVGTVAGLMPALGLAHGPREVQVALDQADGTFTRKNVMKIGRGNHLPPSIQNEVLNLAKEYGGSFPEVGITLREGEQAQQRSAWMN